MEPRFVELIHASNFYVSVALDAEMASIKSYFINYNLDKTTNV